MSEGNEKKSQKSLWDILNYPIIGLTVILTLLLARLFLGFDLGRITRIGPDGLELQTRNREMTSQALTELEVKLNQAMERISHLEAVTAGQGSETSSDEESLDEATLVTVADSVAQFSRGYKSEKILFEGRTGFLWVGNWNGGNWQSSSLIRLDSGQPITAAPDNIVPGSRYELAANYALFERPPTDSKDYHNYLKEQKSLGTIPRGTPITVLEKPIRIQRDKGNICWIKVEIGG